MKKLLFAGVCLLALAACRQDKPKADLVAAQQRDSLTQVIAQ